MRSDGHRVHRWIVLVVGVCALVGLASPATAEDAPLSSAVVIDGTADALAGSTATTIADPDAGESSMLKDVVGGGILVAIIVGAALGFARSSRRFRS